MSKARMERFLDDLANGHDRCAQRHPDFLPNVIEPKYVQALADRLRLIWSDPDSRSRQWRLFAIRALYANFIEPKRDFTVIPAASPFDDAMVYLDRHHEQFRYCKNPECHTPYYIAQTRKPTKYCSSICAGPAKREAKLRWWHNRPEAKHGKK
ncbi:MAG: hypothetical protein ROO76_23875 [Terriglobia bacterium]|nr:hypothetical protein [Terriglobia bacterium]